MDAAARESLTGEIRAVAAALKDLEPELAATEAELRDAAARVANPPHESVPEGRTDEDNVEVGRWGEPPEFGFPPKDHLELSEALGLVDMERGARTSGARFAYLLGRAVDLQFALVRYGLDFAEERGFTPVVPPVLVREEAMFGTGFFPTETVNIYAVPEDELYLVGTAEVPLASFHAREILDPSDLPRRYVGSSTCFRREAGTYGKDTRGLFRVHQFDKLELFSFVSPEDSWAEHDRFRAWEEEFYRSLRIPYRVVDVCVGDLGASAARKYDIEGWLPAQGRYRELTSTSNTTDFQARRLEVRVRGADGNRPVHTVNGTLSAIGRTLIAILENGQRADGSVEVPSVLHPYLPERARVLEPPA